MSVHKKNWPWYSSRSRWELHVKRDWRCLTKLVWHHHVSQTVHRKPAAGMTGAVLIQCDPATNKPVTSTTFHLHMVAFTGIESNTHTHPFNGPLTGTTQVSWYQKGKTTLDFTEARDSEWQWNPLGHMQVCTSLQTDNHASIPPLSFLQTGCPSCCPTNSIQALKAKNRNRK